MAGLLSFVRPANLMACWMFLSFSVLAQSEVEIYEFSFPNKGVRIHPQEITADFRPHLQHLEMPSPGGSSYRSFLIRQKQNIHPKGLQQQPSTTNRKKTSQSGVPKPVFLEGLEANPFDFSTPTDNDIAISPDGWVISVVNSNILWYQSQEDSIYQIVSLEAFADTLGIPYNMYDPRVLYDPRADRFVMLWLAGSNDSTSSIILAFASSADPLNEWFLYAIPGNPLQDSTWSDFPMVALSDQDLYLTVNALSNRDPGDNRPDAWKFLFRESVLWQIQLQNGYNGQSLATRYHRSFRHQGQPLRNLCPIQGGANTLPRPMFLISNRSFDLENDTFFIIRMSHNIGSPIEKVIINPVRANVPYGLPPDARQPFNRFLQTNDARVLKGYQENGKIHFVMNCIRPDTALAAIYHGQITGIETQSYQIQGAYLFDSMVEFGYPSIAFTGRFPSDDQAIIFFNHTAKDSFPGMSAIYYNSESGYSERQAVFTGSSHTSLVNGNFQRWGDYSGIQRLYHDPGKVWTSGFFGALRFPAGSSFSVRMNLTYMALLQSPEINDPPLTAPTPPKSIRSMQAFPNPGAERIQISFDLGEARWIHIHIFDMNGRLIKTMLTEKYKGGEAIFSCMPGHLPAGNYRIVIQDANSRENLVSKMWIKP